MRKLFFGLALAAGAALAQPATAQVNNFNFNLNFGVGAIPLHAVAPDHPDGYYGQSNEYKIKTIDANLLLLNVNVGFDLPLYQMSGGEQALGVSLNAGAGLVASTKDETDGFNKAVTLDFPEYVTYRYGARASNHSNKAFGVGAGLGYRFCKFFVPFNSPSAMLEFAYASQDADYFIRFSGDLRPTRFYDDFSSEGLVEVLRIRELNVQLGYSF